MEPSSPPLPIITSVYSLAQEITEAKEMRPPHTHLQGDIKISTTPLSLEKESLSSLSSFPKQLLSTPISSKDATPLTSNQDSESESGSSSISSSAEFLLRHSKLTHTCKLCGTAFSKLSNLKRHQRIHTREGSSSQQN